MKIFSIESNKLKCIVWNKYGKFERPKVYVF